MRYKNIHTGIFLSRPNRFIAMVDINGTVEKCHVKNTGRCRELLIPNTLVYLEKSENPNRKTSYDLIGINKGEVYINMDSQAPNGAAKEWLAAQGWELIRPECKYGGSRLDFYMEKQGVRAFMEVKGVTLEEKGIARFPDAPTQRGIKHMEELIRARGEGYEAYILFVIQMKGIRYFEPNDTTHPAFGDMLRKAEKQGVRVLAYDCLTEPGCITLDKPVEVRLYPEEK